MKKLIIYATLLFLIFLPGCGGNLNLFGKIYELFFISILLIYYYKNDFGNIDKN
jgi:hypothetical protein